VSTYSLLVDDILEIVSDTIVVHEDVLSRLQRITKVLEVIETVFFVSNPPNVVLCNINKISIECLFPI
jgi:benzoyl-CoA reductase/2-hydroxyglutaryl-CoA dehydratase subunit BcrC/BadD/HgdB